MEMTNTVSRIVGLIMLTVAENSTVRYVGGYFAAAGIYPSVPQGVAWNGNNIGGSLKRGIGIAMHVGFGNISGIISSYLFLPKYAPRYIPGLASLLGMYTLALVLCVFMTIYLRYENARRDKTYKAPSEYSEEEKELEREKGDNATFFRYTV